jgi:hypothetical protein
MGPLIEQLSASSFAVIAASNDGPGDGATAAALALRDELGPGDVSVNGVLSGLRRRLAKEPVTAQFIAATSDAALAAETRPETRPVPAPAAAPPAAAPAPPPPTAQQHVMVDEDRMSDNDRRQVQTMLANVGYYSGRIDGTFGPETRAAIRRYQFEIKAELTGRLTAEQATRLVNSMH